MELLRFLKEYVVSPKYVGSVTPSSRLLADMVTEAGGVSTASSVLEFGPGTGAFTEVIAAKLRKGARFIALEISEEFVSAVRERCPGVLVYHDSAENARRYLAANGLQSCDCIISGLPFALFEDALQNKILDAAVDVLKPGGVFVTFTYVYSPMLPGGRKLRRKLVERFKQVERTRVVWRNFLPAFAYRAIK